MTTAEARTAAAVMGCDFFVLLRTGGQRRSSFSKPDYFEAFAVHYVVDGRTGEMLAWSLESFEADNQNSADGALDASVSETARKLVGRCGRESKHTLLEEVPDPACPSRSS